MSLEIVVLQDKHLEDAVALACARYTELRKQVPLMPTRYQDADVVRSLLCNLVGKMPGVGAIRNAQLVGFLLGFVIPEFRGQRTAFSPEWANAADSVSSRRIYQEMYAHLSARWASDGCSTHLICAMAHDRDAIDGWHWLGFGLCGVDGVRGLQPLEGPIADIEIRRAGLGELDEAVWMEKALEQHLSSAPTFLYVAGRSDTEIREDEAEWLSNPAHALWLAYQGAEVVACIGQIPSNPNACTIIRDEGTTSIMKAFTRESTRGKGIATALLDRLLEWARAKGYERCTVDFEPMNYLAARFWMRHFCPVSYALVRQIDERIIKTPSRGCDRREGEC